MAGKLSGGAIEAGTIELSKLDSSLNTQITSSGGPKVSNLIYFGANSSARASGGQTITLLGSNFASNASVYINTTVAPSVTYISSSNVQFTTPALSVGTYLVYVINPETGAFGVRAPGLSVTNY
jgi:hypothetical protein